MIKNILKSSRRFNTTEYLLRIQSKLGQIRSLSDFVVLCPGVTGYNWMGVNRATLAAFPTQTIELPQYYSHSEFSEKQLTEIAGWVKDLNFSQVILSGFPYYFSLLANKFHSRDIKVKVVYHGFFSEFSGNDSHQAVFRDLIELCRTGIVHSIGFCKKGMSETIAALWGVNAVNFMLITPRLPQSTKKSDGIIRIGVLGNDQFRKNLHNQVVAAAMIHDAEIHVTTEQNFRYIPESVRLVRHKTGRTHADFLEILGSMDINLHLSYSESWGQLTTESLAMGVPCITSYHSDIFDYSEELKYLLVEYDYDNSLAIMKRIMKVLEKKEELRGKLIDYVEELNKIAALKIRQFLEE